MSSFSSHSFQAATCRAQGLDKDAERHEHFMREELADMYNSPSSKAYKSESFQYMTSKNAGDERTAAVHKRHMDALMLLMMEGK